MEFWGPRLWPGLARLSHPCCCRYLRNEPANRSLRLSLLCVCFSNKMKMIFLNLRLKNLNFQNSQANQVTCLSLNCLLCQKEPSRTQELYTTPVTGVYWSNETKVVLKTSMVPQWLKVPPAGIPKGRQWEPQLLHCNPAPC